MATTYNSQGSSNKGFILAIVAICLVGAAGIAGVIAFGVGGDAAAAEQTAPVTVEGDPLAMMPQGIVGMSGLDNDPAVGTKAPTLIGTNFEGEEVTVGPDGRAKVVYFMAHWCNHCRAEMPRVQELVDDGSLPEGLDLYTVSTSVQSASPNYPPSRWMDREGWTQPVIRDSEQQEALLAYGAGGFPFAVYLDGDNNVIGRSAGELSHEAIEMAWLLTVEEAAAGASSN